jgi:hypothetical protein
MRESLQQRKEVPDTREKCPNRQYSGGYGVSKSLVGYRLDQRKLGHLVLYTTGYSSIKRVSLLAYGSSTTRFGKRQQQANQAHQTHPSKARPIPLGLSCTACWKHWVGSD